MTDGFVHAIPNDFADMKRLVAEEKCCAIMLELVQGEGGVTALDKEYVKAVEKLAREQDLLLIIDEVQTGNGRTGSLYAFQAYGIEPDVVTTAKGLGGGLPIGATMLGEKTAGLFTAGLNGSTFGGNPVACAGALSILNRIDDTLLEEVRQKSAYIFETLSGAEGVKSVSGMGLMIGIECEKDASAVIAACMQKGVLVIKAKHKVRLLPALNIPWEELKKGIEIIKEVCKS
jgi:acetylornithine/N-succinyldiaminopimelate aminotransferase